MIFALILAAVTCVDNGDGTWTCSGDGYAGITTNGIGQAVCTNCVNMTPENCSNLVEQLTYQSSTLMTNVDDLRDKIYDLIQLTDDYRTQLQSFTDFPWNFNYSSPVDQSDGSDAALASSILGSSVSTADDYYNAYVSLVSSWQATVNYSYVNASPVPLSGNTATIARRYFRNGANEVAGLWHASYEVAQSLIPVFTSQLGDLNSARSLADASLNNAQSIYFSARSITCDPCQMVTGDGGGQGVEAGCLECYLVFLRRFQAQFDDMVTHLVSLTNTQTKILSQVSTISSYMPVFSNMVQRIDDYLWTDQSNKLANVEAAIIVISNNVDNIQKFYYTTFSNASDVANGVYFDPVDGPPENFQQVLNTVFNSPDNQNSFDVSKYQRLDWFRRIELLLGDIAGLSAISNPASVSDSAISSVNSAVENLENLSDLPGEGSSSLMTNGEALKGLSQSIAGIFPSSPQSITLLEARYWIGDTDLTLNVDSTVVQFARTITGLIWTIFAAVALWLLLVRSWIVLVDLAKFFVDWLPKIFGN